MYPSFTLSDTEKLLYVPQNSPNPPQKTLHFLQKCWMNAEPWISGEICWKVETDFLKLNDAEK